jgi:uncharacterized membrane protein YdbT with pleckstrin-like domain
MSYIKDNLMPNEKILFTARVHPAVFLPAVLFFAGSIAFALYGLSTINPQIATDMNLEAILWFLIAAMLFFMTIRLALDALIVWLTTEFAVTNRRIIAKSGFIHRRTLEMLLSKVESVAVYQSIVGRLLNFGSVTVTGTGGTKESFRAIFEPLIARKKINQIIENYTQAYAQYQQQKASSPQSDG